MFSRSKSQFVITMFVLNVLLTDTFFDHKFLDSVLNTGFLKIVSKLVEH